jgi:predicted hydrolase (HD superfamily)
VPLRSPDPIKAVHGNTLAGAAIVKDLFPEWTSFLETYFLTCLLHDIGTTDINLRGTRMSFEYYGAFVALDFLKNEAGAPKDQAESVSEAIVRHADLGETGNLTSLGQLIQLSTIFGELVVSTILPLPRACPRTGNVPRDTHMHQSPAGLSLPTTHSLVLGT